MVLVLLALSCGQRPVDPLAHLPPAGPPAPGDLVVQRGHRGPGHALDWSVDGRHLATGAEDGLVKVWEAESGLLVRHLSGHSGTIEALRFTPDGALLAVADAARVRVWDPWSGELLRSVPWSGERIRDLAWGGDGSLWLAAGALVRVGPGEVELFPGEAPVTSLDRAGDVAAWADAAGGLTLEVDGRRERLQTGAVDEVRIAPAGDRVAFSQGGAGRRGGGRVTVLALPSADPLHVLEPGTLRVGPLAWSADGRWLAAGSRGEITVWDATDGEVHGGIVLDGTEAGDLALSADGSELAALDGRGALRVWSVGDGVERSASPPVAAPATAIDRRGGVVAVGSCDGIRVWRGAEVRSLQGHEGCVGDVSLSPDGRTLASVGGDGRLLLWEVDGGEPVELERSAAAQRVVAFGPDGARLASGGQDGVLRVWDLAGGGAPRRVEADPYEILALAWSPDGRWIATGGSEPVLRLWDLDSGEATRLAPVSPEVRALDWHGAHLALAAQEGGVEVWDVTTGKSLHRLDQPAHALAFAPDGSTLALADETGAFAWTPGEGAPERLAEGPFTDAAWTDRLLALTGPGTLLVRPGGPAVELVAVPTAAGAEGLILGEGYYAGSEAALENLRVRTAGGDLLPAPKEGPGHDPHLLERVLLAP